VQDGQEYILDRKTMQEQSHKPIYNLLLSAFLFIIGFLPRVLGLSVFLTPDEFRWVSRSRDFLAGILTGNWAATLQTGHPGVTTMWTGSLGILYRYWMRPPLAPDNLLDFVRHVSEYPLPMSYVAPVRFPTVILTSLGIVVFFWLAARFFDRRTALVAACLIALDPFYLALSRVLHHDALATTFMTLSLLPMIGYWLHGWRRRWLWVSGVMAGLAFLSKSSALMLMPFCAIAAVWAYALRWRQGAEIGWRAIGRLILDGAGWGAVAWLTFSAFWPAMWVEPATVLSNVFGFVGEHVEEGHELGNYFLGQFTPDPGPLFYPATWLLRVTPLTFLGLGALLLRGGGPGNRPGPAADNRRQTTALLLAYVLFCSLTLTLGAKKQDRYLLPIFPVVDLLAGVGLAKLWQIAADKCAALWQRLRASDLLSPGWSYILLPAVVVAVQAVSALPHFPYYLTYFNPLLGGGRAAEQWITVGWGEGLDLAAAYLNQKPNADRLKVTAWYLPTFMAYFQGTSTDFFSIGKHEKMTSDYVVFYLNQLQRQMPDPELIAYYQRHYTPEYTAHLHDLDYAWVYAVPIERHTDWQTSQVADKLILYGYRQTAAPGLWTVQLVWENLGTSAQDGLWAALQRFEGPESSPAGAALSWQPCTLAPGFSPKDAQKAGALVESVCALRVDDLEPGVYSLHAGLGAASGGRVVDLLAPRGDVGVSVAPDGTPSLTTYQAALDALTQQILPPGAHPLHVSYNSTVALIGYEVVPPAPQGEQAVTITLYWRALQEVAQPAGLAQSFMTRFDLVAPDGSQTASTADKMLTSASAGDRWRAGAVLADPHRIPMPDELPAGTYHLSVALTKATSGEIVPFVDEASGLLSAIPIPLETVITMK
jgi:4-amino-4-deoxy-L-arabinose transferase-like glycosyltransferase